LIIGHGAVKVNYQRTEKQFIFFCFVRFGTLFFSFFFFLLKSVETIILIDRMICVVFRKLEGEFTYLLTVL